ncbi:hypothetical protein M1146_07635 [Patescibacteria group bacterium]|nr:hypothetical protein [Patescibacteria group bacterium]
MEKFVTENRLNQGLKEICGGKDFAITRTDFAFLDAQPTIKDLDRFVGWIKKDVKKESQVYLEANEMKWSQLVTLEVKEKASSWYEQKIV